MLHKSFQEIEEWPSISEEKMREAGTSFFSAPLFCAFGTFEPFPFSPSFSARGAERVPELVPFGRGATGGGGPMAVVVREGTGGGGGITVAGSALTGLRFAGLAFSRTGFSVTGSLSPSESSSSKAKGSGSADPLAGDFFLAFDVMSKDVHDVLYHCRELFLTAKICLVP